MRAKEHSTGQRYATSSAFERPPPLYSISLIILRGRDFPNLPAPHDYGVPDVTPTGGQEL